MKDDYGLIRIHWILDFSKENPNISISLLLKAVTFCVLLQENRDLQTPGSLQEYNLTIFLSKIHFSQPFWTGNNAMKLTEVWWLDWLDLAKPFDKVPHRLLQKLNDLCIICQLKSRILVLPNESVSICGSSSWFYITTCSCSFLGLPGFCFGLIYLTS